MNINPEVENPNVSMISQDYTVGTDASLMTSEGDDEAYSSSWDLPTELLVKILCQVDAESLMKSSCVSLRWREIINDDSFWLAQCAKRGISRKQYLLESTTLQDDRENTFQEPNYDSPLLSRLSPPCYWRGHLDKYRWLEKNWRHGVRTNIEVGKVQFPDVLEPGLGLWDNEMLILKHNLAHSTVHKGRLLIKNDRVVYVKKCDVICKKYKNMSFSDVYTISLPVQRREGSSFNVHTTLALAGGYLIVRQQEACYNLLLYDSDTGKFESEVKLQPYLLCEDPVVKQVAVCESKVFVVYEKIRNSADSVCLLVYNIKENLVVFSVLLGRSSMREVSRGYVCTISELWGCSTLTVRSALTGQIVDCFECLYDTKVKFTSDNKLVYSERNLVFVNDLIGHVKTNFSVDHRTINQIDINSFDLLIITTNSSIELWDPFKRCKLYNIYSHGILDHAKVIIDDKYILFESCNHERIVAFW